MVPINFVKSLLTVVKIETEWKQCLCGSEMQLKATDCNVLEDIMVYHGNGEYLKYNYNDAKQ